MFDANFDLFSDLEHTSCHSHNQETAQTHFTFIDLFAGIGGFHSALKKLGGECVFASEIDKHARETYKHNHGIDDVIFNDDIRAISPCQIPDHDLLCAGFPCQPFSQAGKKKGFKDGENSERGNLFFNIVDILEAKRPKAFILENVRHLLNHDEGRTFATILSFLKELHYDVSYKIIKASDFNVPQHRARIFIVGFDSTAVNTKTPFMFPRPVPLTKTMSDIFGAPCNKRIGFTLRVGGKGSTIDDRRNWEFYRVNGEVKRIGLKEATEMMGFEPSFQFPVSKTQAMKQLGNSVCIPVVSAIAKHVLAYINQHSLETSMPKQNKGELSEVYALLKLINQRLVNYGDEQGNPTQQHIRVIRIHNGTTTINLDDIHIKIISHNTIKIIQLSDLFSESEMTQLANEIKQGKSTFSNQKIDDAIAQLHLSKTKGTSKDKADITLSFEENKRIFDDQGIGIKSFLGAAPTLLNASQATNFIYEITNARMLNSDQIDAINNIETRTKIRDRIQAIQQHGGQLQFYGCENSVYESNLRKVDSDMPVILAEALLNFFSVDGQKYLSSYPKTLNDIQKANEISVRLKDFVQNTMLGIFPTTEWDGNLSATGVLLVKQDGSLVFYHTNQARLLKDYFYTHTFFDTPSSTRHRFGLIYNEGNKLFFKLNLQLRLES